MRAYTERRCPICKEETVSILVHDYGVVTFENFDEKVGVNNIPVKPTKCLKCGKEELPDYLVIYDGADQINRIQIGSRELPVVGTDIPYGVVLEPEEEAELERGMAKVLSLFEKQGEGFWDKYCQFALENWKECLAELLPFEFNTAYQKLGYKPLPSNTTTAVWRKDAVKKLVSEQAKIEFWRAANQHLIDEFLWDGNVVSWPVEKWVRKFGRTRTTFIVLHLPLPEELESIRTEKLSLIIRKKSGDTGVLFERINYLGRELDRQRRRSEELGKLLLTLRQEKAAAEERLGETRRELAEVQNQKVVYKRDPDDIRKIREFKGLISELREEVKRLESLIPHPKPEPEEQETVIEETIEEFIDLDILKGKTVAVFGKHGKAVDAPCRVVWHDGDSADQALERLALDADIYVILTRFISHEAMWRLRELAIDMDKRIIFTKRTNIDLILNEVVGSIRKQ